MFTLAWSLIFVRFRGGHASTPRHSEYAAWGGRESINFHCEGPLTGNFIDTVVDSAGDMSLDLIWIAHFDFGMEMEEMRPPGSSLPTMS